jgi:branched-chain amino acid transport system substrate-binding protein
MINVNKLAGLVAAAAILAASPAMAADVKVGILGDITGPIEALAGPIVKAAQTAFDDVNAQGGILDGKIVAVTGDSACDPSVAGPAADKLVNTDQVVGIVGALCTGATIGAATAAGIPGGVVMISPSSTAPALTTLDDKDLVFRTVPSDAFQGVKLADLLIQKGIKSVALTYVNNDYGKGLADVFKAQYAKEGGTISADVSHEDGKADYRAELGTLAAGGDRNLVIIAYASGSAHTILQQAVEAGDFDTYIGVDGVIGDDLLKGIDPAAVNGHLFATRAGAYTGEGAAAFDKAEAGLKNDKGQYDTYVPQAYDAAFLLALAIEKNGKADRAGLSQALRDVATAPGEKIFPGQWKEAVAALKAGKDIDYEGASGPAEFDQAGDVDGIIVEVDVQDGKFVEVGPVK